MAAYWAVKPITYPLDYVRIEQAETARGAVRRAYGSTNNYVTWEAKNLGTRKAAIVSDSKRITALNDRTGWVCLGVETADTRESAGEVAAPSPHRMAPWARIEPPEPDYEHDPAWIRRNDNDIADAATNAVLSRRGRVVVGAPLAETVAAFHAAVGGPIRDMAPPDGGIDRGAQEDEARERAHDAADEHDREVAWDAFVTAAKSFAALDGWPSVLNAVARAMREQEKA